MEKPILLKADSVLKIGQRVELSIEGDTRAFASRLEDIQDSVIALATPLDERRQQVSLEAGAKVKCKVYGGECYYMFDTVYKYKASENILLWYVTRPEDVQKIQYRGFVRVKTTQQVQISPVNEEGVVEPAFTTSTVDLSGGGLCFSLKRPLPIRSKVGLEIAFIPGTDLIQLMSRVIRCSEVDVNGSKVYQIGVEFLAIDRSIQNKIVKFIFDLQRDSLAKLNGV